MKLKKLIIKDVNDNVYQWDIKDLYLIEFHLDWIRINDIYLDKKDFYYPHWRSFIEKLNVIFDFEEN